MRLSRFVLSALAVAASPALAQVRPLQFPAASPRATVSQKVGLTDVTVRYSRPAVAGRKVWGGLVPFGEVWRNGADENTILTFSTPVTVGGKTLPAGAYGLHTIPGEKEWTVILSTQAAAWGSYSYDAPRIVERVGLARRRLGECGRQEEGHRELREGALDDRG